MGITINEIDCDTYEIFESSEQQVSWYISDEFVSFFHGIDFDPTEAGTYEICAGIETPDCPQGAFQCETIVISEDCFENNDCPLEVSMTENSCPSFTFEVQEAASESFFWLINDDFINHSDAIYTFEAVEAGTFEICTGYETSDCPQAVVDCRTVTITEDCLEGPTNTDDLEEKIKLTLTPNPAHDYMKISLEAYGELSYQILDISGKLIRNVKPQSALNHHLDISQLASGVYVIHAIVDGRRTQLRFVKQ